MGTRQDRTYEQQPQAVKALGSDLSDLKIEKVASIAASMSKYSMCEGQLHVLTRRKQRRISPCQLCKHPRPGRCPGLQRPGMPASSKAN